MEYILRNVGIPFRLDTMFENKNKSYDDFIQSIIDGNYEITGDILDIKIFDNMEYDGDTLVVSDVNIDEDDIETLTTFTLHSANGFTLGLLLYRLAQFISEPDDDIFICSLTFDVGSNSYLIDHDY